MRKCAKTFISKQLKIISSEMTHDRETTGKQLRPTESILYLGAPRTSNQ